MLNQMFVLAAKIPKNYIIDQVRLLRGTASVSMIQGNTDSVLESRQLLSSQLFLHSLFPLCLYRPMCTLALSVVRWDILRATTARPSWSSLLTTN